MEVWNSVASTCMYYTEKEVLSMENYSPVSTLLRMSKSIEGFSISVSAILLSKFSPYICGFRKNLNS